MSNDELEQIREELLNLDSLDDDEMRSRVLQIACRVKALRDRLQPASDAGADRGPWYVGSDGRDVLSNGFTNDVALRISGDFRDENERWAYAEWLCAVLNTRHQPASDAAVAP